MSYYGFPLDIHPIVLYYNKSLVGDNELPTNYSELMALAQKLIEMTGNSTLIEGNWWNDRFWGVDSKTGIGENHLGKLLMELRAELVRRAAE